MISLSLSSWFTHLAGSDEKQWAIEIQKDVALARYLFYFHVNNVMFESARNNHPIDSSFLSQTSIFTWADELKKVIQNLSIYASLGNCRIKPTKGNKGKSNGFTTRCFRQMPEESIVRWSELPTYR